MVHMKLDVLNILIQRRLSFYVLIFNLNFEIVRAVYFVLSPLLRAYTHAHIVI